eukprot:9417180-Pyramimonas_sp.AAC.1
MPGRSVPAQAPPDPRASENLLRTGAKQLFRRSAPIFPVGVTCPPSPPSRELRITSSERCCMLM